jgi:hypothetical protein
MIIIIILKEMVFTHIYGFTNSRRCLYCGTWDSPFTDGGISTLDITTCLAEANSYKNLQSERCGTQTCTKRANRYKHNQKVTCGYTNFAK